MGKVIQVNSLQSVQIDGRPYVCLCDRDHLDMTANLEESEQLVNLGSTILMEPFFDDGSSEDGMISQDNFLNASSQNTRQDNPHR